MQISVTVQIDETDSFNMSSQEVANAIFSALGADESKDTCMVTMQTAPSPPAFAGAQALPPPPEET